MLGSSRVLPVLVLQLLLEQSWGVVVPGRDEREVHRPDQDPPPRLDAASAQAGLSVGSVLGVDARPSRPESRPESVLEGPELSIKAPNPRKNTQKRRKLAPLDNIGGFLMSRYRSRQDEPDLRRGEYRK